MAAPKKSAPKKAPAKKPMSRQGDKGGQSGFSMKQVAEESALNRKEAERYGTPSNKTKTTKVRFNGYPAMVSETTVKSKRGNMFDVKSTRLVGGQRNTTVSPSKYGVPGASKPLRSQTMAELGKKPKNKKK